MTLFRPATGQVRAKGVTSAPNAVLHPWLQAELARVLADLPPFTVPEDERPLLAQWETWLGPYRYGPQPMPPLRLILIWDNLAGHLSAPLVLWLYQHGVLLLYTPLSGSWLNLAESFQRILVRRALRASTPHSRGDHHLAGGDGGGMEADPTPFTWAASALTGASALACAVTSGWRDPAHGASIPLLLPDDPLVR